MARLRRSAHPIKCVDAQAIAAARALWTDCPEKAQPSRKAERSRPTIPQLETDVAQGVPVPLEQPGVIYNLIPGEARRKGAPACD
jgi:hypothetical protein